MFPSLRSPLMMLTPIEDRCLMLSKFPTSSSFREARCHSSRIRSILPKLASRTDVSHRRRREHHERLSLILTNAFCPEDAYMAYEARATRCNGGEEETNLHEMSGAIDGRAVKFHWDHAQHTIQGMRSDDVVPRILHLRNLLLLSQVTPLMTTRPLPSGCTLNLREPNPILCLQSAPMFHSRFIQTTFRERFTCPP